MHYITAPQMAYSLFLKVTMESDHGKNTLKTLDEKWAQYIIRNKDIRLMEKNEIDDFMRLLKNLRGGITQIVK